MIMIDMEMPKNCNECRMVDDEFEYCHGKEVTHSRSDWLELNDYTKNKTKPDWCPLIEVKNEKE